MASSQAGGSWPAEASYETKFAESVCCTNVLAESLGRFRAVGERKYGSDESHSNSRAGGQFFLG